MQNNIKKDYTWNTIGVLLQNAISPLLLIIVTRVNGIYDSGLFSFAFSVAVIFWIISIWGGRTYQVSDINREFTHRSYIMVRLVLTILTMVGAFVFSTLNHYDQVKTSLILILVLFKAVESVADAIHGVLQINDRLYVVGKSLSYKAAIGLVVFVGIDLVTHSILIGSFGLVFVNVMLALFYDLRIARRIDLISIPFSEINQVTKSAIVIMKRTWPIFAVIFLSMFSLNIPRYFIDLYHQEEIGYFGILAMPITLIALVMTFVLQPKVVHLAKMFDQKNYENFKGTVRTLLVITGGIGAIILVGAYLIGIPALNAVFGVDFSQYQFALLVIVLGGILNAIVSIFINIFTIIRRFKQQFYILLISNVMLAFCSPSVIHIYGLNGGVILFAITNFTQLVFMIITYKVTFSRLEKAQR